MLQNSVFAVDLSKHVFHVIEMSTGCRVLSRKKLGRLEFALFMGELQRGTRIFMEACSSAHHWCRLATSVGLEAQQIAPHHVRPFVGTQKNDYNDAIAIAEVGLRGVRWCVPTKSVEQQELESLHRIRERRVNSRTALMNQMRGLLGEFGIVLPQGKKAISAYRKKYLSDERLSPKMGAELLELYQELDAIEELLSSSEQKIKAHAKKHDVIKRLMTIPGVGIFTATALWALSGDPGTFKNGRAFAASLGLVPRQRSTGGKTILGGITKQGDSYTRRLLINGAQSLMNCTVNNEKKLDRHSLWIKDLHARRGRNPTAVAIANKNARIAWAILTSNRPYEGRK